MKPKYSLLKIDGDKVTQTKITAAEYEIILQVLEEMVKQDSEKKEVEFNKL